MLHGRKFLEIIQNHYTEERIFRIAGDDSKSIMTSINMKAMTGMGTVERINDVTVGRYSVKVDQVPMSVSFQQAQFEEAMEILTKLGPVGQMLAQTAPHLIVEMSSLPNKQDWKQALMGAASGLAMGGAPGMMAGPGAPGQPSGAPAAETTTPEGMPS
jgi:hypothetical protein